MCVAQGAPRNGPQTQIVEPASSVYEAVIVERPKGRSRRVKNTPRADDERRADRALVKDLVIRRKSDGEIIVRTPADLGSSEAILKTVEGDLRHMTADEFFAEWKMPTL